MRYDAIVIGAGNGGLTSALLLSKQHKKVLLLDASFHEGGSFQSVLQGRFEFDFNSTDLMSFGDEEHHGKIYELFSSLQLLDKIHACKIDSALCVYVEQTQYEVPSNPEKFLLKMAEYVKDSKEKMSSFLDLCRECAQALDDVIKEVPYEKIEKKYPKFIEVCKDSCQTVMKNQQIPKLIQEILSAFCIYYGNTSTDLAFVTFASYLMDYLEYGYWALENGHYEIQLLLQEELQKNAGDVYFGSAVTHVQFEDGLYQMTLEDGRVFVSPYVIGDISPTIFYTQLLDEKNTTRAMYQLSNARTMGESVFTLCVGLNRGSEALGLFYDRYLFANAFASEKKEKMLSSFSLNVDRRQKKTTILTITAPISSEIYCRFLKDNPYDEVTLSLERQLLEEIEKALGVNLMDAIEELEVVTPVMMASHNLHPNGTVYGYLQKGYDNFLPRFLSWKEEQYLPHLYFCGASSCYCMDTSQYLSGEYVALQVLKEMEGDVDDEESK